MLFATPKNTFFLCNQQPYCSTMNSHESPIIHILRSVTLLTILIAVPGIAIFWNHLPKNVVNNSMPTNPDEMRVYREESLESTTSLSPPVVVSELPVQQVSWEHLQTAPLQQQKIALLEQRLRELGATRLEMRPLGNRGDLYSFSCHVPLSETSSSTRPFQDTATDPISAMQSVIADIERWKGVSPN